MSRLMCELCEYLGYSIRNRGRVRSWKPSPLLSLSALSQPCFITMAVGSSGQANRLAACALS